MPSEGWVPVLIVVLLVGSALSGCIGTDTESTTPVEPSTNDTRTAPDAPERAVVADIGQGTNPYHEAFRRPNWSHPPQQVIDGMPKPERLNLTLGETYNESREADERVWSRYEAETLYWVPGTNLLLYTDRPWEYLPDGGDKTGHSTASTNAIERVCEQCYILAYVDSNSLDGEPTRQIADNSPWVDAVTSTNFPGSPAESLRTADYAKAMHRLYDSGRFQFVGAGNSPVSGLTPLPYPHYSLPPWAVTVGGAYEACSATEPSSGKPNDFVGNYSQVLADTETVVATDRRIGTSFSTPQVAGSYSKALIEIRESLPEGTGQPETLWSGPPQEGPYLSDGNLTHVELLDAFKHAAQYFASENYRSGCSSSVLTNPTPVSPTPWVEMGWGYVGSEEAEKVAEIVVGETEAPSIRAGAQAWMQAQQEVRGVPYETVWDEADEAQR